MWGKMTGPAAGSVLDMPLVIEPGFAGLFSRGRDALCCNEVNRPGFAEGRFV